MSDHARAAVSFDTVWDERARWGEVSSNLPEEE